MPKTKYDQFDSWEIKNNYLALKTADKSFFHYHGTGIPKPTKWFWGVEKLLSGERKDIVLQYTSHTYHAHITLDVTLNRARLFWNADLADVLNSDFGELFEHGELLVFSYTRISADTYILEFVGSLDNDISIESSDAFEVFIPSSEGTKKAYYTTRYERDPRNRAECIRIHGTKCSACGFDFGSVYGNRGQGYIEVHHQNPLYSLDEPIIINPATDLAPVCANCHRMLHRTRDHVLSIDELKDMLQPHS